jgi:hypothetical protein
MTRHSWGWRLGVLAAALLLAGTALGSARAQYPPPTGNVTSRAPSRRPACGTTTVSALVRDVRGGGRRAGMHLQHRFSARHRRLGLSGACLHRRDGHGDDHPSDRSTPGPIIVVGSSCGELSAQVSVVAGTAQVQLPATGMGPADGGSSGLVGLWVLLGASVAALGVLLARDRMRRTRR